MVIKIVEKDDLGMETTKQIVKLLPGNEEYGVYRMDIAKTGNCFIATPTEAMGGPDAWVYAKLQNNDSLINPLLGLDFNTMVADEDYGLDVVLISHINELSRQAWAQIQECKDLEDLNYIIDNSEDNPKCLKVIFAKSAGDVKLNKATNPAYDPSQPEGPDVTSSWVDQDGSSPYTIYQNWLNQYGDAYVPATGN